MRHWSVVEAVRGGRSGSVMGRTVLRSEELIGSRAYRGRVRVRFLPVEIHCRQLISEVATCLEGYEPAEDGTQCRQAR